MNTPICIFLNIQNNFSKKGKTLWISEYRNVKEGARLEINVYCTQYAAHNSKNLSVSFLAKIVGPFMFCKGKKNQNFINRKILHFCKYASNDCQKCNQYELKIVKKQKQSSNKWQATLYMQQTGLFSLK